jgi:hypothetical protein
MRMHALRVLRRRNAFPAVVDALDPGGSGNPYADLDDEERGALREATLLGFPLRSWWNHETLDSGYFSPLIPGIQSADPSYVDDFWSRTGYLGADRGSSIQDARVRFETTISGVVEGDDPVIQLASLPEEDFADADFLVLSGEAIGQTLLVGSTGGTPVRFSRDVNRRVIAMLKPGDRVQIDNSWALALQTYQRHQVPPSLDLYGWNQFRDADGHPLYPQRPHLIGLVAAARTAGSTFEGHLQGKTLVLEALMDIDAVPWQADWYRSLVKDAMGPDFNDNFALWFIDHVQHDDPQTPAARCRTVSYEGALQQGLRDLATWVERDVRPAETAYTITDAQVQVPETASARGGIQPVVELRVNGTSRAVVCAGEQVHLEATIDVPPGAGQVVSAEWCFNGSGDFIPSEITPLSSRVHVSASFVYQVPGTYFPVLRAASHRDGRASDPHGRIQNLGRARVVVVSN